MKKSKETKKKKKGKDDDFDFLGRMGGGGADLDLNDPELMKELKQMGWDEEDNEMEIDPELAELEKKIEEV